MRLPTHRVRKIKTKMLLVMVGTIMAISLSVALLVYRESTRIIEDTYQDINRSNLTAYSDMLDIRLRGIVDKIRATMMDESFYSCLREPNVSKNQRMFDNARSLRLANIFNPIVASEPLITSIAVFDKFDRFFASVGNVKKTTSYFNYYLSPIERQMPWYDETLRANGKERFYGYNVLADELGDLSITKMIRTIDHFDYAGIIVVTLSKEILGDLLLNWDMQQDTYTLMVVDEQKGDLLVYEKLGSFGSVYSQYLASRNTDDSPFHYLFMKAENSLTGWTMVNGVRKSDLGSAGDYILSNVAGMLAGVILAGLLISFLFTSLINKPLDRIKAVIRQFGSQQPISESFDDNEIGVIGNTLKQAINQNLKLNQRLLSAELREKESELQLLQAQINPHFLYNTLDSLYCMAVIHNADEIADMTAALSDMFKITLNRGKRHVRLADEMEYIQHYMLIQNLRHAGRFQLSISASDEARCCFLLKFLIQPFVENAFLHGLEPKIGYGSVWVRCWVENGLLLIEVEDDGVGIADMRLVENGYGIRNVRERIRLFYGTDTGVEVTSTPHNGTKVRITLLVLSEDQFESWMHRMIKRS